MKKSIAVDIGNVSIAIRPWHFAAILQLDEQETAFYHDVHNQFEWGKMNEEQYWQALENRLPRHSRADIQAAFDGILLEPVPGTEEFLTSLEAQGFQPVYFSDISPRHLADFKQICTYAARYPGIYSFDVGSWKPSEAMFQAFEKQYGIPALYIDDRLELIQAAQKRGWNAIQFTTAEDIRAKTAL